MRTPGPVSRTAAVLALVLLGVSVAASLAADGRELVVFHLNDAHGFIFPRKDGAVERGGFALLASALGHERQAAAARRASTLFLFAGDMFQGTPVVEQTRGECMVSLLNELKLDAACLGNHEFDYGQATLADRLSKAKYPVLATNLKAGKPLGELLRDELLIDAEGIKVGIVGATTPETKHISFRENVAGVEFSKPAEALKPAIQRLRDRGAQVIVALTHIGIDFDRRLAEEVSGIDLIVGGHSHSSLVKEQHVGQTTIVQAGDNCRYMGMVRLSVEDGPRCRLLSYQLVSLLSPPLAPDPAMTARVAVYMAPVEKQMAVVVGSFEVELPQGTKGDFSPSASIMAEAFRESCPADIAVVNVGGVRRGIKKGPITAGQVYELAPYGNNLVTMTVEGRALRACMERSIGGAWGPYTPEDIQAFLPRMGGRRIKKGMLPHWRTAGILQFSGLSCAFDPRLPEGRRIVEASVGDAPLDDSRKYSIVLSSYLAAGGDGMVEFRSGENVQFHQAIDRQSIVQYLARHSPVAKTPPVTVRNVANELER